jgi:hypothetical protein
MDTEIKKLIHLRFDEFRLLFTNFFEIPEDEQYDKYEFKTEINHENQTLAIEKYWNAQILPLSIEVNTFNNADEKRFLIAEFDSYYHYIIATYYGEDYRPHHKVGKNIASKEFELLSDNEKEWHLEAEPFLRQKNYLYELLHTCKQQIKYPESLELKKSTLNKLKESPKTFKEIFKVEDWQKYIDALVSVQLLDSNYNFDGNANLHKGVIASWFYSLQNDFKVIKKGISRAVLMKVVNNELPNLDIKSDKLFERFSVSYQKKYRERLENYIENVPTLPK